VSGQSQLSFARHCLLTLSFVIGLGAGFARASRAEQTRAELARRLRA
jgi:hypothetical protein